jgi:hypothetical protein
MRLEPGLNEEVERLRSLHSEEGILSVYLPIDPAVALHHGHVALLMDLLRPLRQAASRERGARLEAESEKLLAYVREEYTPRGSVLCVFSSAPAGVWTALTLPSRLPAVARFETSPFLAPIDAALEDLPPSVVALINQNEARLLRTELGGLGDTSRMRSAVPGRQRQGGWSAFRYERDRQEHVDAHMRRVAGALDDLLRSDEFEYLALGGTDEATHALESELSESLRSRLAGRFHKEMFATDNEVLEAALPLIEAAERARERALVEEAVQGAFAGGRAALGVDETLQVLNEGRAHLLVIGEAAYHSALGDQAAPLAWSGGARLEVVHGEAEAMLEPHAGIGALLRY